MKTGITGKIIALIDGSIYSESVCHHAAWISQRTGAPVELIQRSGARRGQGKHRPVRLDPAGRAHQAAGGTAELDAQRAKLVSHRGRAIPGGRACHHPTRTA